MLLSTYEASLRWPYASAECNANSEGWLLNLQEGLSPTSKKGSIIHLSAGKPWKPSGPARYLEAGGEGSLHVEDMRTKHVITFYFPIKSICSCISPTRLTEIFTVNTLPLFFHTSFVSCKM